LRRKKVEAGAEQRIDDQGRLADRLRIERQHRMFPPLRRRSRITLQAVPLAQQHHRNLAAASGKLRRRHEAIAAIVARPGDDENRPLLGQLHRSLGHGLPRAQHQREAGHTRGDGEPVGALHFSCGENFHAKSPVKAPHPEAFPMPREARPPAIAYRLICLPIW
jgi:hypothetical protein